VFLLSAYDRTFAHPGLDGVSYLGARFLERAVAKMAFPGSDESGTASKRAVRLCPILCPVCAWRGCEGLLTRGIAFARKLLTGKHL
jgi:hypothetical protein